MKKIDQITNMVKNRINEGLGNNWILINPKTERELFLDGSLKKNENIDEFIVVRVLDSRDGLPLALKTVTTNKVEDFVIL